MLAYFAGGLIERRYRVDDAVGAVAVHGVSGFLGIIWVGIFAAGYPTGLNNVESSIGGQLMGLATFVPLGFLSGYVAAWVLKKLNFLRVPLEVELEGLDMAEYETDFYPEHARAPEMIVEPDGTEVPSAAILTTEALSLNGHRQLVGRRRRRRCDGVLPALARLHERRHRRRRTLGPAQAAPPRRRTARYRGGLRCPRSSTARPSCVAHVAGAVNGDDADFILQKAYEKCAGFMTFGPGTTYGDGASGAATSYYILTWIGIIVMVAAIVFWVLSEDRRLKRHVTRIRARDSVIPQP